MQLHRSTVNTPLNPSSSSSSSISVSIARMRTLSPRLTRKVSPIVLPDTREFTACGRIRTTP
jgi:hypothetical protein